MKINSIGVAMTGLNQVPNALLDPTQVIRVPSWVSGNPAGLAISTSVDVIFDLGENWQSYKEAYISIFSSGSNTTSSVVNSAARTGWVRADIIFDLITNTSSGAVAGTSNTTKGVKFVPQGRWLTVSVTNAATAVQGADANVRLVTVPA